MWSTYLIATPRGVGTGVIVNQKDKSAPGGIRPVLVTSAHVLETAPQGPFYLVCRHQQPGRSPLIDILEIDPPDQAAPVFVRHPRYDVAAMEIELPLELVNEVELPSFLDESAIAARAGDLHAGDDVSVLGFPSVFPGTKGGFAVLRSARVASYSAGPPSAQHKFMINTNVYSGDSGGPVFRNSRRGRPQLVGILTERVGKIEGSVPFGCGTRRVRYRRDPGANGHTRRAGTESPFFRFGEGRERASSRAPEVTARTRASQPTI